MALARLFQKANGCAAVLVGLAGFGLAGEGAAEPFVWVDESGHTHFGHGARPEAAVEDIDGLRSIWRGQVIDEDALASRDRKGSLKAPWREAASPNFRVWLDGSLFAAGAPSPSFALGAFETARSEVESVLGVAPESPLRVILYGERTYSRLHDPRFGFGTVGFYDGQIHVVAPVDRPELLRARFNHEYAHAVFRDQVGGDRPYWLNEGWAWRFERRLRDQPILTSDERSLLLRRVREGQWIPIRRLGESFSSLGRDQVQGAYLQSALAVEWLEEHTRRDQRSRLLKSLGEGRSVEDALYEATGVDIDEFERRLLERVRTALPAGTSMSGG